MITESLIDIRDLIKGRVLYNEPMKGHTSFKTGGPAEIWIEPVDIEDLRSALGLAKDRNAPVLVVGGGTNLLIPDEGIRGMVISITSPNLKKVYWGDFKVAASSSVRLADLLSFLKDHSLSGLEFLAGVPGTVGGAVACRNYIKKKRATQDLSLPSAGCIFKNPGASGVSAGELIDRCGLKGRRVGGALISLKHANFIVNTGSATSADIMELIGIARNDVKKRFGIELELEIQIV